MATVLGENIAPGPGQGLATVLRNDYVPLRIMQQGDAVRARRAAADAELRRKQAEAIARQWAEDRKIGLDTGGLFQQPFNDYTADAQNVIGKHYADEAAGRITTAQRVQNIANYKNEVERERLLGIDKDKLLANYETSQAGKPFRDMQGLHTALGATVLDENGKRVRASTYDERGNLQKLDADPTTYNADPIIGDYYKGLQASTIDEANAGRIGGIHSSSSLTYKGLLPVKRADGTWDVKRDVLGRPVIGTTATELDQARASNHNLNMAVGRLRADYDAMRRDNPTLPQKSDLDLFQEASQKYVSFRQADSEGRNAQPRQPRAAAAQAGFAAPVDTPLQETRLNATSGGYVPGVTPGAGGGIDQGFANVFGVKGQTNQYAGSGDFAQPLFVKKSGEKAPIKTDGFAPDEYFREGADGQLQRVKNNKQAMAGIHGPAKGVYVDAKTGDLLPVQSKVEGDALVASGKADLRLGISFYGDKNENFGADKSRIKKDLLSQVDQNMQPKYTEATAEAKATEMASKGVARNLHLYNDHDAKTLNATTGPAYQRYNEQLKKEQARLRAGYSGPKNPGGSVYRKDAPATTPTAPASRGGSIYKIR